MTLLDYELQATFSIGRLMCSTYRWCWQSMFDLIRQTCVGYKWHRKSTSMLDDLCVQAMGDRCTPRLIFADHYVQAKGDKGRPHSTSDYHWVQENSDAGRQRLTSSDSYVNARTNVSMSMLRCQSWCMQALEYDACHWAWLMFPGPDWCHQINAQNPWLMRAVLGCYFLSFTDVAGHSRCCQDDVFRPWLKSASRCAHNTTYVCGPWLMLYSADRRCIFDFLQHGHPHVVD